MLRHQLIKADLLVYLNKISSKVSQELPGDNSSCLLEKLARDGPCNCGWLQENVHITQMRIWDIFLGGGV